MGVGPLCAAVDARDLKRNAEADFAEGVWAEARREGRRGRAVGVGEGPREGSEEAGRLFGRRLLWGRRIRRGRRGVSYDRGLLGMAGLLPVLPRVLLVVVTLLLVLLLLLVSLRLLLLLLLLSVLPLLLCQAVHLGAPLRHCNSLRMLGVEPSRLRLVAPMALLLLGSMMRVVVMMRMVRVVVGRKPVAFAFLGRMRPCVRLCLGCGLRDLGAGRLHRLCLVR